MIIKLLIFFWQGLCHRKCASWSEATARSGSRTPTNTLFPSRIFAKATPENLERFTKTLLCPFSSKKNFGGEQNNFIFVLIISSLLNCLSHTIISSAILWRGRLAGHRSAYCNWSRWGYGRHWTTQDLHGVLAEFGLVTMPKKFGRRERPTTSRLGLSARIPKGALNMPRYLALFLFDTPLAKAHTWLTISLIKLN